MNLVAGSFPLQTYRNLNLSTTGQIVKASKGYVHEMFVSNNAASARFLKFYDKATAPTNSDTPIRTYELQANASYFMNIELGVSFLSGISIRASTGVADNDNTAPSANDVIVNIGYL